MLTNQDIRQLGEKELQSEIAKTRADSLKIKLSIVSGHSKEVHKIKELKNYLARLLTISSEMRKATPKIAEVKTEPKAIKATPVKAEKKVSKKTTDAPKKTASKKPSTKK